MDERRKCTMRWRTLYLDVRMLKSGHVALISMMSFLLRARSNPAESALTRSSSKTGRRRRRSETEHGSRNAAWGSEFDERKKNQTESRKRGAKNK